MPPPRLFTRYDTLELKAHIERKLGFLKADRYFSLLNQFINLKIGKSEFHPLCIATIGRDNLCLHNRLIVSILKNASLFKTPPPKAIKVEGSLNSKITNGYQRTCLQSLCRDAFPQSPRKGRTPNLRDRKFRDRPSPLGPLGKSYHSVGGGDSVIKSHEQKSATSLGSRPLGDVNSVEDGEEVEQAAGSPGIRSRSPVRAPLGIPTYIKTSQAPHVHTFRSSGGIPDAISLRSRLEQTLETEGLTISGAGVDLLNTSLNVFLKRLIKPCLELASSRAGNKHPIQFDKINPCQNGIQRPTRSSSASILDFQTGMELNPQLLGPDWPVQLERIYLRSSEVQNEICSHMTGRKLQMAHDRL